MVEKIRLTQKRRVTKMKSHTVFKLFFIYLERSFS